MMIMSMSARRLVSGAVVAAAMGVAATQAGAVVLNFDDFTGQQLPYWEEQNFLFNPAKSNNDTKCYEEKCLMEIGQGDLTTMTYDASGLGPYGGKVQGEVIDPSPNYGDAFNLDFFYFVLVGLGTEQVNSLTVLGNKVGGGQVSAQFILGNPTGATATGASVSFATDEGSNANNSDDDTIQNNVGYWVDLDDQWNNLLSVSWLLNTNEDVQSAQARLDCVGAFESGLGSESSCKPTSVPPVPLPAAGWLLLAGVGGLVAMRRRKAA
jgi:hypothetical protein